MALYFRIKSEPITADELRAVYIIYFPLWAKSWADEFWLAPGQMSSLDIKQGFNIYGRDTTVFWLCFKEN